MLGQCDSSGPPWDLCLLPRFAVKKKKSSEEVCSVKEMIKYRKVRTLRSHLYVELKKKAKQYKNSEKLRLEQAEGTTLNH